MEPAKILIVDANEIVVKAAAFAPRAAGVDRFIAKPPEVTTLAAQVSCWLEGPETVRASRFMWP